jgi:single-strand DNA-binding protein
VVQRRRNLAEICKQHLLRGQQVYVEGRLQTRGWEDMDGKRHFRTEIVANEMVILGPRRQHLDASTDDHSTHPDSDDVDLANR